MNKFKWPKCLAAGALLALILSLSLAVPVAAAVPLMSPIFSGSVTIGGDDAPIGTTVSAEIEDVEVASVETSVVGHYAIGFDDDDAYLGKTVVFKVNGFVGGEYEDYVSGWDEPTVTLNLSIEGEVDIPDISVSPTSKDFGSVTVGSSSSPQTFTVSNVGSASLVIGTITVTGTNANQFSKQSDNCSEHTIAAGGSATLQIVFSPTSTGAKSATLSIPSNDPDEGTVTRSLSGTGVTATTTTPPPTVTVTETPPPVTITETPPPGTVTTTPPPGTVTETPPPGTVTTTQPPGTVTETPPPGTVTTTQPPGTVTETPPPGTVTTTQPPETVTETPPPGTVTTTQPPETVTETEPGKPQINWPLTGGLIAAVVVVGLGVFFWMRRRAA